MTILGMTRLVISTFEVETLQFHLIGLNKFDILQNVSN